MKGEKMKPQEQLTHTHTHTLKNLIRLGNIGKHNIDHTNKHSVLVGVSCVFNDGDNIRALLGLHV